MALKLPLEIIINIEKNLNIKDSLNLRIVYKSIYNNILKDIKNNKILVLHNMKDFQYFLYYLFLYTNMIQYEIISFINYENENTGYKNIISSYVLSDFNIFDITVYLYNNKYLHIINKNLKTQKEKKIQWNLLKKENVKKTFLYFIFVNNYYTYYISTC